jgi:XTP/dITP diphosphohydrolase
MNAPVTFLIATRNAHKVGEIRAILGSQYHYLTLTDFPDSPKVIEDAGTFAGNATKKAVELAKWLNSTRNAESWRTAGGVRNKESAVRNMFVLADDSGLEVDALNGAPGVHSARFAALDSGKPDNSTDAENNAKLLRLLKEVPKEKRTARFRCVLALTPAPHQPRNTQHESSSPVCFADELEMLTEIFDGTCEGWMDVAPRGQGGFGYDPLFIPNGYEQSFAELGEEIKNQLSHRSKALAKLREKFQVSSSKIQNSRSVRQK